MPGRTTMDGYLAIARALLVVAFAFPAGPFPSTSPRGAAAAALMGVAVCLAVLTIFVRMAPPGPGARALPPDRGVATLEKLLVSAAAAAAAASVALVHL